MWNRLTALVAALAVLLTGGGMARSEIVDRIIATVNGEVITLSDFYTTVPIFRQFNRIPASVIASEQGQRELAMAVFSALINLHLLDQQADQHDLEVNSAIVDQYIQRIARQMGIEADQLDERLQADGITVEDFREYIRLELTKMRVISTLVTSRIAISDAEIDAALQERYPGGAVETVYDFSQIRISPPPRSDAAGIQAARDQAQEIRGRILDGEDFAELAREFSQDPSRRQGGEMGEQSSSQLPRDFERRLRELSPGEVSEVFQTRFGFHIVRLNSRREESSIENADEIREEIFRELMLERQNEEVERYLAELHDSNLIQVLFNPIELFE